MEHEPTTRGQGVILWICKPSIGERRRFELKCTFIGDRSQIFVNSASDPWRLFGQPVKGVLVSKRTENAL